MAISRRTFCAGVIAGSGLRSMPATGEGRLPRQTAVAATGSHIGNLYPFVQAQADKSTLELSFLRSEFKNLRRWQTTARSGVRYFKTGYWRYSASPDVKAQVTAAGEALAGLAALARDCGIELGFHNHAAYIGAALWEIAPAMDRLDPRWAGYYFDPRHAVAEGGGGAWKAAVHLVSPRLKMVALKDCFWVKGAKGWVIEDCPLGQGMVDWGWMGAALRTARFRGPISVHLEYDIPGNTAEERTRRTLEAGVRDLAFARGLMKS